MLSFFNGDFFLASDGQLCNIFIDFMFNVKLFDHNAHMQEELEKANQ
jgi:hypothetical protein